MLQTIEYNVNEFMSIFNYKCSAWCCDSYLNILVQHGTYSTLENVVHLIIRSVEYTAIHSIVDLFGFN